MKFLHQVTKNNEETNVDQNILTGPFFIIFYSFFFFFFSGGRGMDRITEITNNLQKVIFIKYIASSDATRKDRIKIIKLESIIYLPLEVKSSFFIAFCSISSSSSSMKVLENWLERSSTFCAPTLDENSMPWGGTVPRECSEQSYNQHKTNTWLLNWPPTWTNTFITILFYSIIKLNNQTITFHYI